MLGESVMDASGYGTYLGVRDYRILGYVTGEAVCFYLNVNQTKSTFKKIQGQSVIYFVD
jgi:hypothetical protein